MNRRSFMRTVDSTQILVLSFVADVFGPIWDVHLAITPLMKAKVLKVPNWWL